MIYACEMDYLLADPGLSQRLPQRADFGDDSLAWGQRLAAAVDADL